MKILITGANGFIGKALTKKLLNDGNEVFGIGNNHLDVQDINDPNFHFFDILFDDYGSIASKVGSEIDIVYHLAWSGLSGKEAKNVERQLSNVLATAKLVEEISKLHVKKLVFSSTMNTIEVRNMLDDPLTVKPRGVDIHVASKINAEVVARTLCYEKGIQYNEALIAMAYGENNKSHMITNVFIYSLLNGISPKLVEGNNHYDLIYIDDIADALSIIGEKGIDKKSYYVGHNWNKTFREIFEEIQSILSCKDIKLQFGSFPDDNCIDFSKINRDELFVDTQFRPRSNFKESILKTAEWIKNSGIKFI